MTEITPQDIADFFDAAHELVRHVPGKCLYKEGDLVKKRGSKGQWHGRIVGRYSTSITSYGYAVESALEKGSVQIYPESALEPWTVPGGALWRLKHSEIEREDVAWAARRIEELEAENAALRGQLEGSPVI